MNDGGMDYKIVCINKSIYIFSLCLQNQWASKCISSVIRSSHVCLGIVLFVYFCSGSFCHLWKNVLKYMKIHSYPAALTVCLYITVLTGRD